MSKVEINISVVVPTYNRKKLLEKSLISLFKQTYSKSKYEIIVVDDGSTDNTKNMIKNLQQDNKNLVYLQQENRGPAIAKNQGVLCSKGKIIVFIDSDCLVLKSFLEIVDTCFNRNLGIAAYVGSILLIPKNHFFLPLYKFCKMTEPQIKNDKIYDKPNPLAPFYSGCGAIRKSVFKAIGGFNECFKWAGEDTDLGFRIMAAGYKICCSSKMAAFHHEKNFIREYIKGNYLFAIADTLNFKVHFKNWVVIMNSPQNIKVFICPPFSILIRIDVVKVSLLLLLLSIAYPPLGISLIVLYFLKHYVSLKKRGASLKIFFLYMLYKYSTGVPRLIGCVVGSVKNRVLYI